ncbi:hypothetical protein FOL75_26710 [Bacillus thuringiensis]|uniref:hypothetical protein n=1 Tax=Bacillus thuringiensis TaxID=1428 RepID=UPI002853D795|nr:hypothetical protein [Bacillus thuringiensis]MDR5025383.1 hypothetical protein [Bacillus thuringiensis]
MKILFFQPICIDGVASSYKHVYKKEESTIIPHKGDMIEDSLFKKPNEVIEVTINYTEDECTVNLSPLKLDKGGPHNVEDYVNVAVSHGWKKSISEV